MPASNPHPFRFTGVSEKPAAHASSPIISGTVVFAPVVKLQVSVSLR
ncbi:MAG: hypothetical protein WCH05_08875 [Chlorobiaceae bacterium]